MKIEETDGMKQAHKIATATMCSAKVQATIGTLLLTIDTVNSLLYAST